MNASEIKVGARVAVMVRGREIGRGKVTKIEAPPREMTGGRGITVRGAGGFYASGYDPEDLRALR